MKTEHHENPNIVGYEKNLNVSFTVEGSGIEELFNSVQAWMAEVVEKGDMRLTHATCNLCTTPVYRKEDKKEDKKK